MPLVRPKVRDDLTVVELDGEAVIYDEATTELHHLNPTATIVFRLCDGTCTMREMSVDIADAFGVPADEVEPQVRSLIRTFRGSGLLQPTASKVDREEAVAGA
jgi:PqqD family protein of HPr-rel-A system